MRLRLTLLLAAVFAVMSMGALPPPEPFDRPVIETTGQRAVTAHLEARGYRDVIHYESWGFFASHYACIETETAYVVLAVPRDGRQHVIVTACHSHATGLTRPGRYPR
ncbi:hypothetical protein ACFL26_00415 [Patescibacteria group bacterium]